MKGIFVVIDGLGDRPNKTLEGKTPLEAADTPNLDFLSARGELGYMYPIKQGFIPDTVQSLSNIFGNNWDLISRGQVEAKGAGLNLTHGDLVFRANFATTDNFQDNHVIDRRAGRTLTTAEAKVLSKALNTEIKLKHPFQFVPTKQHRGVLVFNGGFSDNITATDKHYDKINTFSPKFALSKPLDDDDDSKYSADLVNEFSKMAFEVLDEHPVNEARRQKGLMPANFIGLRGAGSDVPKLKKYRKWSAAVYSHSTIGLAKFSDMTIYTFKYPYLKNHDVYYNLSKGLKYAVKNAIKAVKKSKKKFNYIFVYFKETDLPGHDNKPLVKKEMLEFLDKKFFSFLRKFAPVNKIKVVVTGDHSTPCELKDHSADPVPVLFYNNALPRKQEFNEKTAKKGNLGKIMGKDLLKTVGFLR